MASVAAGRWWSVRSRAHIDLVSRSPHRASGRFVAVRVASVGDGAPPRLLLAVSRQVGPAVVRNRVRRRIRHALRGCSLPFVAPAAAPLVGPLDAGLGEGLGGALVMVRATPASATATWSELADDVCNQLGRALVGPGNQPGRTGRPGPERP
jgi:ribonuclease P protein component